MLLPSTQGTRYAVPVDCHMGCQGLHCGLSTWDYLRPRHSAWRGSGMPIVFTRTIKRLFENHCTSSGVYNYRYLAAPRLENSLARVLTSTPYLVGNWWNPLACAEELDLAWSSSFGCSCPVCPAMASGPVTSQAARIASHHPHLWTLGCLSLIAPSWGFKFRKHSTNRLAESSSCLLTTCGPRGGGPPLPPGSLQSDSCLLLITQALVLLFNLAASQVVEGEKQGLSW